MMKFFHATPEATAFQIASEKEIRPSWDGFVYLCKEATDACKFLLIRGIKKMCVFEVELDESAVQESFDHSKVFFGCDAYMHEGSIKLNDKMTVWEYNFNE